MKEGYKVLGEYIRPVDERNRDLSIDNLLGVSIEKKFIPSIANIIGTDLSSYKIVRTGQFAYGPVTSRNGEKISIALLQGDDCIISSSYSVFEIVDKEKLDPEYLMLWFSRPEFDRYARFRSHGSVREIFDWDEMCAVELPVPSIEMQREIVKAYRAITERIELKRRINDNLEDSIFYVFNKFFPNIIAEGKTRIKDVTDCVLGGTPSRDEPDYWGGDIAWINSGKVNDFRITSESEFITSVGLKKSATKMLPIHTVVLAITGATLGQESITLIECCANQSVVGILETPTFPYQFIHPLIKVSMKELLRNQGGGAQPHINKDDVGNVSFNLPDKETIENYLNSVNPLFIAIERNCHEIDALIELESVLVAKLSR
jgi:restriction endonuclease S subunit